jgi:hypothetical protein
MSPSYTPFPSSSSQDADENQFWLDRELSLIESALEDKGEMERGELGDLLGCRYWGPRRYAHALKAGVEQGRFRRVGRNRYAPSQ